MKTLYIVRHARSSWKHDFLNDQYRPLKKSGYRDALSNAERVAARRLQPDLVISSPAIRAYSTALIYCEALGYPAEKILLDSRIYESSAEQILGVLKAVPASYSGVMIFGHHPSLTDLVNRLAGFQTDTLPTAAIAAIKLDAGDWHDAVQAKGTLQYLLRPEKETTGVN